MNGNLSVCLAILTQAYSIIVPKTLLISLFLMKEIFLIFQSYKAFRIDTNGVRVSTSAQPPNL